MRKLLEISKVKPPFQRGMKWPSMFVIMLALWTFLFSCNQQTSKFLSSFESNIGAIVSLEDAPDGTGSAVSFSSKTAGDEVTVYAVLRDINGKFLSTLNVSWVISVNAGSLLTTSPSPVARFLLTGDGRATPGSDTGTITANHSFYGSGTVFTTVSAGTATKIIIETAADGSGNIVDTRSFSAGSTETFYAVTRDVHNNFVGVDTSTSWSVGGGIGIFSATPGSSTTFTAQTVGTNIISADSSTLTDDTTGNITVTIGPISQVKIEDQNDGNGSEITTSTKVAGETLTAYAVTRDAFGNFVGVDTVNWSVSNSIGTLSSSSGLSTILTVNLPGTGVLTADHASFTDDTTGNITATNNLPVLGSDQVFYSNPTSAINNITVNSATDADAGHTISYTTITTPTSGTLTNCMNLTGSTGTGDLTCTYDTGTNTTARVEFTYRASDSFQNSATNGTVEFGLYSNVSANVWAWMEGVKTLNGNGVYGTQGVENAANLPGARNNSATWEDGAGMLWMLGGFGYDEATGATGSLNDLWKYNVSTGNFVWVSGSKVRNQSGVYFTTGTPHANNSPGGRDSSAFTNQGNTRFWMFGGNGYDEASGAIGSLSDLWYYDTAAGQWVFVKGDKVRNQAGTYGTKGTANTANKPGGRRNAVMWIDTSNNVWLFGGLGYDSVGGTLGYLNDMWKFDGTDWTWISGENLISQGSVFGTQGTPAAANTPSSRGGSAFWMDNSGNFWLFGGFGFPESGGLGELSDMWMFNPTTNQWTYIAGPKTRKNNGSYSAQYVSSSSNFPGGRLVPNVWKDSLGNFWMMGGRGFDETNDTTAAATQLNDIWIFNTNSKFYQWAWIEGSKTGNSVNGTYGTISTESGGILGSREGANTWYDSANNRVWIFGGFGLPEVGATKGYLQDMWRYRH